MTTNLTNRVLAMDKNFELESLDMNVSPCKRHDHDTVENLARSSGAFVV
jgi:hypothetical protein